MKQTRGRVGGLRHWIERAEFEPLSREELRRRVEGLEADLVEVDELLDGIEERHEWGLANGVFPSSSENRERAIAHGRRKRILAELTERRPVLEREEEKDAGRDSEEA